MTFPLVPLAATVELLIGGNVGWVDITEDVRLESAASGGGIQITRGRSAEGNQADPGRCLFTIDNRSGRYSPRNPMGEWYGLFGRNTPVRVGVDLTADSFTRTVGAAWGQTDDGRTWSVVGTSSEYSVAGSHAVQQHPTKGVNHFAYLDQDWQDIEQVTSASVPAIPVGASVVAGHLVRYDTATGDHYWLRLVFTPDAAIWVQILKRVGGVYTTLLTKSGVGTFTPGQKYNLRSSVCGSRLSVKAWPAGTVEPVDWTASITDGSIAAVGRGGLASRVDGGNTNISEVRFDDYRATDRRFFGEVSSWPIRWDVGGFDRWVPVEASGILRRLNQGKQQELSPLRRTILASSPLAYWPLEDGVAAQQAASAVPGIPPMLVNGSAEFVTVEDDTFGSTPTLRYGTSALLNLAGGGSVASQTLPSGVAAATDQGWTVAVAIEADVSQAPGDIILFEVQAPSAATFARWQVIQRKTTFHTQVVGVKADGTSVVLIDDNGYYPSFGLFHLSVWQSGTSIGVRYMGSPTWTTAVTGSMAGGVTQVVVNSGGQTQATPMPTGHVALWAGSTMPIPIGGTDAYGGFVYAAEFSYRGEVATGRLARLCAESGVPLSMPPVSADHVTRMGWQPKATLAELIAECVAADGGILAEQRDGLGLMYRPRESLYNQTPVPLSYTAGHISPPFEPVEDDAGVANDVTVTREDGSSYRAVQRTGPLAAVPPPAGIGVYDTSVELNLSDDSALGDIAGRMLRAGTINEARYPSITADFTSPGWLAAPGLAAKARAADSGGILSLNDLPVWVPPGPVKVQVRGYTERLDAFDWDLTWNAAPGSPWDVAVTDGDSRAAAEDSKLSDSITGSAASFSIVSSTASGRWTTDPAHFPMDVRVGAERVTLSGIAGAGLTQTATVSARGVNGVQRDWPAGTEVNVWNIGYLA